MAEKRNPTPGDPGYGDWSWAKAIEFIREIRPPDIPVHEWLEMIHKGWLDYHELAAAVAVCRDINDAGEHYTHPNADETQGLKNLSQALENLFSLIDPPEFDEDKP